MKDIVKLPARDKLGHKGTFGTVTIMGGHSDNSSIMFGGVALSALASLKTGAGLVQLFMNEPELSHSIELVPQAIGLKLPKNPENITNFLTNTNSVVAGIAFGVGKAQQDYIGHIIKLRTPTVIDADGINNLANYETPVQLHEECILTPHVKEFERICEAWNINLSTSNQKNAQSLAKKAGCIVVFKDSSTVVADSNSVWALENPSPSLATGGSGDALSGIIGSLLAQFRLNNQLSAFDCAQLGVKIHSEAAASWSKENGDSGMLISELLEQVPKAMQCMRKT